MSLPPQERPRGPRRRTWPTALAIALAGTHFGSLGCSDAAPRIAVGPIAFERVESAIPTRRARWNRNAFDVVAADMDLDGDPDLLLNWHHLEPLELFENLGGRFVPVDPARSGLLENRDIGDFYVRLADMEALLGPDDPPGLYIWHDLDRRGAWRFSWRSDRALDLELTTSLRFTSHTGLETDEVETAGQRVLRVRLPAQAGPRSFSVRAKRVATRLELRAREGDDAAPLFVGAQRTPVPGGRLELWKTDPHGVAWVDAEGSPHPEIFITRGGLGGLLRPPAAPKQDRYYVATGRDEVLYRRSAPGTVPPTHARGRRVAWVDLEGDGVPELSISNEATPNALLVRDPTGVLRDRAPELGLDLLGGAIQAWSDLDDDGLDDCFVLEGQHVDVLRNEGERFRRIPATSLGLVLAGPPAAARFLDRAALRFVDVDADGDLDLFVLTRGEEGRNHLLRRDAKAFVDVTAESGLADVGRTQSVVLFDADADGLEDAISFGAEALLWHNRGGARFDVVPLDAPLVPERILAAGSLDADGDGRGDVVALGSGAHLLRNVTSGSRVAMRVSIDGNGRGSLGARVTAIYAGGRRLVRRHGSVHSTPYSQALGPLSFGALEGALPREIEVRWPGGRHVTRHPVSNPAGPLVVRREP